MELKNLFKLAALTSALALAGCGGDINVNTGSEGNNGGGTVTPPSPVKSDQEKAYGGFASKSTTIAKVDGKEVWVLKGTLAPATGASTIGNSGGQDGKRIVLGNDVVWLLEGAVVAGGDNANQIDLEVQAGTKIIGASESYLVISRGSKIKAEGTESAPIVFTSVAKGIGQQGTAGQWGGLVLLGNAPVNTCPDLNDCSASFEVGNHNYGGNKADDNSGSLKYVRVEFGGFKINDTQEMNGISFGAVGSGTKVSHIQIHENNDDGIEFWGGSVSVKNVVLTNNFDDSLDWTNGWTGAAQHVYIRQKDNGSNRGIEADSNSEADADPMSNPVLANFTIEVAEGKNSGGDDAEGILFRKGTGVKAYNLLVKGMAASGECVEVNGDSTVANAQSNKLTVKHSIIDCAEPFKDIKDGENVTFDASEWFMAAENKNLTVASDLNGYQPNPSSPALTNGKADLATEDSRLDNAEYVGAFDGTNDWTKNWTTDIHGDSAEQPLAELPVLNSCPAGTTSEAVAAGQYKDSKVNLVCGLSGNLKSNVKLLAGSNVLYKLKDGAVLVGGDNKDSATLGIQAGVNIFGEEGSYIAVSRGSKIMATGSKERPIVMTSEEDVIDGATPSRGQWGGLVLLGNGLTNKCSDKDNCDASFEVGNHSYGGNNNADNSGQLSYVVVKYAGFKVNDTQEMNGISFAAVGSGTQVDHIQVHANGDDGVEFWGGAVNLKYVYLTHNFDDSLDWTNGWTGKVQHLYITHEDGQANRGIEADSHKTAGATPISNPTLSNVTILPGVDVKNASGDAGEGIILRVATKGSLHNVLIQGRKGTTGETESGECLELDGSFPELVTHANDKSLQITHSVIDCNEPFKYSDDDDNSSNDINVADWFNEQDGNSATAVTLTNGKPAADDATLIGKGKDLSADSFFDKTNYIGAFDGQKDWTEGWTFNPEK
ncbi:hypothetical protein D5018_00720 [Parashewanella curva]|uniref:Lipoprotein n=1 Tax=Parashewanella curva TaxID=2338552 RepID=A0A3L8Q3H9_9GAMM|nr:hypothetical protein [Parashewanella curva]RLV61673.1 hypothetical protein D5018_00720 [Parashewanella curva]